MCVGASPTSKTLHRTSDAIKSGQGLARAFPENDMLHRHWGVVRNGQEFSHSDGQVWVKKLLQAKRICMTLEI